MWKEVLAHFSSYYRVWQSSRNTLQESTSYFYHYCINYRSNFSGPKSLLKVQVFEKRRQSFQWKKIDQFSACYRVWQYSRNNLKRSMRYSGIYFGSNKINSLGPQLLLKKQIFDKKKATFPMKKILWVLFSRFMEHEKCQGTFYKGLHGFLTFMVQMIRSFLWDQEVDRNKQFKS